MDLYEFGASGLVLWMSEPEFWISGLVFACLDLHLSCLNLYLGCLDFIWDVWTCILNA